MDSSSTVITLPRADTVLVFDGDSLRNTVARQRDWSDSPEYSVRTSRDYTRTELCDATGAVLAKIEYRSFLPDQIVFTGQKAIRLSNWMTPADNYPMVFEWRQQKYFWLSFPIDLLEEQKYQWRSDQCHRLLLYHEGAALSNPVAWYDPVQFHYDTPNTRSVAAPATFSLRSAAADPYMRDAIVAALLVVEHRERMSRKNWQVSQGRLRAVQPTVIFTVK